VAAILASMSLLVEMRCAVVIVFIGMNPSTEAGDDKRGVVSQPYVTLLIRR
jgi:hypothetical protein